MGMFRLIAVSVFVLVASVVRGQTGAKEDQKPKISFTFDDGSTTDAPILASEEWNDMILKALDKHQVKAVFFATGGNLKGAKGAHVLDSWDRANHKIANHTYSHHRFGSEKTMLETYERDVLANDKLIRQYRNFYPYFRFPYLNEGNIEEKTNDFQHFLSSHGYKNGRVTIDASDWYMSSRLVARLKENPTADVSGFRQFYLDHTLERAIYYDSLATVLTGRKVTHTLLLHHNLAAALFLDDLIQHFKDNGWEIVDAEEAFKDPIFEQQLTTFPTSGVLTWTLVRQYGLIDSISKDTTNEEEQMDALGL